MKLNSSTRRITFSRLLSDQVTNIIAVIDDLLLDIITLPYYVIIYVYRNPTNYPYARVSVRCMRSIIVQV